MRLWSLHPKYLDTRGLTACWREALLARKVLEGATAGYRQHPQLLRFRSLPNPVAGLDVYLRAVCDEAERRGYRFDRTKIGHTECREAIPVTTKQLLYEKDHLLHKLRERDPGRCGLLTGAASIEPHPLFTVIEGEIESWEKR